jgi:DNA-binding NtrC family response regulator
MDKIKILIVDDETELVFPMAERMEIRGFDVKAAEKWSDALKYFETQRFDIAVLDIKMPGMSGLDLMKMIFHLQKDIKIILMSGHGTEEEIKDFISKGASDLMIKPLKMENLILKINEILGIR